MPWIKLFWPSFRRAAGCGLFGLFLLAGGCAADGNRPASPDAETATVDTLLRVAARTRSGGDLASAVGLYQRAHLLDPKRAEPLVELGFTLSAMGAKRDAATALRTALALEPENANARRELAYTLLALSEPQAAYEEFRQISERQGEDAATLNGMGVALDRLGDHARAQANYRKALSMTPENLSVRNNLGLSLALNGKHKEAIRLLQEVAVDSAASPRERQNLALAYGLAGDFEAAAKVGRIDLKEGAVQSNLAYYRHLRTLSETARVNAVMTGQPTGESAVAKGAPD